jgi:hypothetical protein
MSSLVRQVRLAVARNLGCSRPLHEQLLRLRFLGRGDSVVFFGLLLGPLSSRREGSAVQGR